MGIFFFFTQNPGNLPLAIYVAIMLTCENHLKAYFKINTFELAVSIPIIKDLQNLLKKPES